MLSCIIILDQGDASGLQVKQYFKTTHRTGITKMFLLVTKIANWKFWSSLIWKGKKLYLVQSLDWEDPWGRKWLNHYNILAGIIPRVRNLVGYILCGHKEYFITEYTCTQLNLRLLKSICHLIQQFPEVYQY